MPTLVIDNVPVALFDRIQRLANAKKRTASETALEALESAFRAVTPTFAEAPPPQAPFLTEEICAPFSIPRPEGTLVVAARVDPPLPSAHDIPDEE